MNKLERVSVTGDDRSTLRTDLMCVQVLTIDYASVSIYWIDHCLYEIQSLRLDGDETTHSFPFDSVIIFASGLVIYHDTFFWSEYNGVFEISKDEGEESMVTVVHRVSRGSRCTGVQLVHPSMQPQGTAYCKYSVSCIELMISCAMSCGKYLNFPRDQFKTSYLYTHDLHTYIRSCKAYNII